MNPKKTNAFLSADHLDERAASRIREAALFPPGEARQHALNNAAQLRSFAEMKRELLPDRATLLAKAEE